MADPTTNPSSWLDAGVGLGQTYLSSQGASAAQTAVQNALAQGSNYIDTAYNRASNIAQPYMNLGEQNLAGYNQAANNVGNQMTMDQFKNSPYWKAAEAAQKQQADQITAQQNATGGYWSGNTLNALNQNALTTTLGAYDTATKNNLANQQAAAAARYQPVALGQNTAMNLGVTGMDAAKYRAQIAGLSGVNAAAGAETQTNLLNKALGIGAGLLNNPNVSSSIVSGVKNAWQALTGNTPTGNAQQDLQFATQNQESLDVYNQMYGTNYKLDGGGSVYQDYNSSPAITDTTGAGYNWSIPDWTTPDWTTSDQAPDWMFNSGTNDQGYYF